MKMNAPVMIAKEVLIAILNAKFVILTENKEKKLPLTEREERKVALGNLEVDKEILLNDFLNQSIENLDTLAWDFIDFFAFVPTKDLARKYRSIVLRAANDLRLVRIDKKLEEIPNPKQEIETSNV
jgi:hypothetical protein